MALFERRLAVGKVALVALLAAGSLAAARRAAGDDRERTHQAAYLADAPSRRSALIASLVNPDNAYGRLRRAHYATGTAGDWDRLRAWNPRVAAVTVLEREPRARSRPQLSALPIGADTRLPPVSDLHALGEAAFFRYPAQLAPVLPEKLSAAAAARYG